MKPSTSNNRAERERAASRNQVYRKDIVADAMREYRSTHKAQGISPRDRWQIAYTWTRWQAGGKQTYEYLFPMVDTF